MSFTDFLSRAVYGALLLLIVLSAIPYGTVEPWWKAAFICGVFGICLVAAIEFATSGRVRVGPGAVLWPMLALSVLAFAQSLPFGPPDDNPGHLGFVVWRAISADPYQTRFFVLQLLALTACLALFYRYAASERRIRVLVYAIVGVAVASAVFGILRQTMQHHDGFLLPLLKQNQGFAQFVNKNHFAYLMELAFGLGLGMLVAGGVKREQLLLHVALLLPIWIALVLANSRGGVLAMLVQIVLGVLLLQRGSARTPRLAAFRVVLLVVLVAGVLFGTLWVGGDRLASNFEAAGSELSANTAGTREGASRNEIWRATLKMFAAHPLLGVGLGGYWIGITAYHDASGALTPQEAHNEYLELLASGGVVGLALGVWFAVSVVRLVRRRLWTESGFMHAARVGAVLGIAGVTVHSLVDFGLHLMSNALVFLALIVIATTTVEQRDRPS